MKCDICQINEADDQTPNGGNFCFSCENKFMEAMADETKMIDFMKAMFDENKMDDFLTIISVDDVDKIAHEFGISKMSIPGLSIWKAEEIKGGYQFGLFVKSEENQAMAIEQLRQKILTGLEYKTLKPLSDDFFAEDAIHIGEDLYSLNSVGTCRIQADAEETVYLVIDGKTVSLKDFGQALIEFEEFNMDFQIRDMSDDVLGKNMTLRPVDIHPDVIMEHFERTLGWFLERDFLSYQREVACVEALVERVYELELLYQYGSRDEAVEVGKRMQKRLNAIDHDSDHFPNYLLEMIDRVIHITGRA